MWPERHVREMSEHRNGGRGDTEEGRQGEKVVEGMEEMIEKGHGKVTGSEGVRPKE